MSLRRMLAPMWLLLVALGLPMPALAQQTALERASTPEAGEAAKVKSRQAADWSIRMAAPTRKEMVPMRDGVRLATFVYLPEGKGPFGTILIRTIYKDGIQVNWANSHPEIYYAAGYAVVWQMVRGKGGSEGHYRFLADDKNDGYDTVEWIAAQPWSDGNVGMDQTSYLASTQLSAAASKPPHLKAIVPHAPAVDLFREIPYNGGIFIRSHQLSWHTLISVDSKAELAARRGDMDDPAYRQRLLSRPLIDSANGFLTGDDLAQYREFVAHPPAVDDYWRDRQFGPRDFANMDVPVMLVTGNFDPAVGTLTAWRGMDRYAPHPERNLLLIGPWTHTQTYLQGETQNGPYKFGNVALIDMWKLKIAFFDKYMKGKTEERIFPKRVRVFVTGSNVWRDFDTIPVPERQDTKLFLASQGRANSIAGDGILSFERASGNPDKVVSDPENPVVDQTRLWSSSADKGGGPETKDDVLIYTSTPIAKDLTVIGEPEITVKVAADTRDADLIVQLSEIYPDGKSVRLGVGGSLRLRYRNGYDREELLKPGKIYDVRIPLSYIGHTIKAGHRLRIQVSGTSFPSFDPNPNTGEPIATAVRMQRSNLSIFHDTDRPSFLMLPVVPLH